MGVCKNSQILPTADSRICISDYKSMSTIFCFFNSIPLSEV